MPAAYVAAVDMPAPTALGVVAMSVTPGGTLTV